MINMFDGEDHGSLMFPVFFPTRSQVDCSGRALDTDTGSCESLTDDRVRCEALGHGGAMAMGSPWRLWKSMEVWVMFLF